MITTDGREIRELWHVPTDSLLFFGGGNEAPIVIESKRQIDGYKFGKSNFVIYSGGYSYLFDKNFKLIAKISNGNIYDVNKIGIDDFNKVLIVGNKYYSLLDGSLVLTSEYNYNGEKIDENGNWYIKRPYYGSLDIINNGVLVKSLYLSSNVDWSYEYVKVNDRFLVCFYYNNLAYMEYSIIDLDLNNQVKNRTGLSNIAGLEGSYGDKNESSLCINSFARNGYIYLVSSRWFGDDYRIDKLSIVNNDLKLISTYIEDGSFERTDYRNLFLGGDYVNLYIKASGINFKPFDLVTERFVDYSSHMIVRNGDFSFVFNNTKSAYLDYHCNIYKLKNIDKLIEEKISLPNLN